MITQVKEQSRVVAVSSKSISSKPFGLSYPELFALFLSLLALVGVVVFYFTSLKNEQEDLKSLRLQIDSLIKTEEELKKAASKSKEVQADEAKSALESLDSFKTVYLKNLSHGANCTDRCN